MTEPTKYRYLLNVYEYVKNLYVGDHRSENPIHYTGIVTHLSTVEEVKAEIGRIANQALDELAAAAREVYYENESFKLPIDTSRLGKETGDEIMASVLAMSMQHARDMSHPINLDARWKFMSEKLPFINKPAIFIMQKDKGFYDTRYVYNDNCIEVIELEDWFSRISA